MTRHSHHGRVLVMTQPLGSNYGGILQAFALQRVIREMGFDAVTNNGSGRRHPARVLLSLLRSSLRSSRNSLLGRPNGYRDPDAALALRRFVHANIQTIDLFGRKGVPDPVAMRTFSAVVTGSDQVWRVAYSDVPRHLLNFVDERTPKFSYAASFGTDSLDDYTPELVAETARLAKRLNAISVREDSGVDICRRSWNVAAERHVDPTLLLTRLEWADVARLDDADLSHVLGGVLVYVLDESETASQIATAATKMLNHDAHFLITRPVSSREHKRYPERYRLRSVAQWLQGFMGADFVVTDSFHGCVFAILFNKPFVAIGNERRGLTRFTSLLQLVGLEDRLVSKPDDVSATLITRFIDWQDVNDRLRGEIARSRDYLQHQLLASATYPNFESDLQDS